MEMKNIERMPSSGMLCDDVALIRTDVSEERSAYIITVTIIGELGIMIAVTRTNACCKDNISFFMYCLLVTGNIPSPPILVTLMMVVLRSSETSVLTRATRCNIPGDSIIDSHRCENLKSYMKNIICTMVFIEHA
jgi:hypothetical protein